MKLFHCTTRLLRPTVGYIKCFCSTVDDVTVDDEAITKQKRKYIHVRNKRNAFIDWKKIHVKGGKGGDGVCKFMNSRTHKGGPYGGDGAPGGDVIAVADENTTQLKHLESQYTGGPGGFGRNAWKRGKRGKHVRFTVPIGTCISNAETKEVIAELVTHGDEVVLAEGGEGGLGNEHFKSPERTKPIEFTKGGKGQSMFVEIEMKSIADIGLVGMPNVGKSTLLGALTRAKPKIADYPFTTLRPNLGVIQYDNGVNMTIADIPGLIEGAHDDKGLGHSFLRHVERCRGLLFVIDSSQEEPLRHLNILQNELTLYQRDLCSLPALIVANKVDLVKNEGEIIKQIQKDIGLPVLGISAKFGYKTEILKTLLLERFYFDGEECE